MPAPPAAAFPGPDLLGRGVVLGASDEVPAMFAGAATYLVDETVLAAPALLAQALHHHWARRERTVVRLAVPNDALREREVTDDAPWELGPWFGFERERLAHRIWANSYDLRTGEPVWWHGEVAARHTDVERAGPGSDGDVVLADGTTAWVDGGPRGPVPALAAPVVHRESVNLLRRADVDGDGPLADDLTAAQHAAATHAAGSARVLAPAGAGKTRVLTARLGHLVRTRGIQPQLLTAVAYNRRAADELRQRVGDDRVSVRTIHSLAWAICRDAGASRVLDERETREILAGRNGLVRLPQVQNQDPAQAWFDAFSEVRIGLRDPAEVETRSDGVEGLEDVLRQYRAELRRRDAVDHDEQVCRAIEELCRDPRLRDAWRMRCTHLLVDEFQDLTPAYVLLLRLLGWPDLQVFGVGDDDQVIYGHAGADPGFMLDFDALFPGAADHRLPTNHRCPRDVVDAADTLLTHNRRRVAKHIEAREDAPMGLDVEPVDEVEVAAEAVDRIEKLLADGAEATEIAILTRVNASLLPFEVSLRVAGIPCTAAFDPQRIDRRTGLKAAFAWLDAAVAVADDQTLTAPLVQLLAKRPSRKVSRAIAELLRDRTRWSFPELQLLTHQLSDAQGERWEEFLDDLSWLAARVEHGDDTAALLRGIRERIGLGEAMDGLDTPGRMAGTSHGDDLTALEQVAAHHTDPRSFRRWLKQVLEQRDGRDGVHLSSIHRVKGEEWPHVIVAPAASGLLPHRLAEDVEEERRVFHVAVTRGSVTTTVLVPRGNASPFVRELTSPADDPGGDPHGTFAALAALPVAEPAEVRRSGDRVEAVPGLRLDVDRRTAVVDEVDRAGGVVHGRMLADGAATDGRFVAVLGGRAHAATRVVVDGVPTELTATRPGPAASPARTTSTPGGSGGGLFVAGLAEHADPEKVEPLYEQLRQWRTERSRALGKPAYTVFDNKTLRAIAERQPRDERELLSVPGVGPAKLEQFGDEVLEIVADALGG